MMGDFFGKKDSILYSGDKSVEEILGTVAGRYMADNPSTAFTFRACSKSGFIHGEDLRYHLDFDGMYPDAPQGAFAFAFAKVWSDSDTVYDFFISLKSPAWIYINGSLLAGTVMYDETFIDNRIEKARFIKGWNSVFIKCEKNLLGFGCIVGSLNPKWAPLNFYVPYREYEGQLGWSFTSPVTGDVYEDNDFPGLDDSKEGQKTLWYPQQNWEAEKKSLPNLSRIFGTDQKGFAYGITTLVNMGIKQDYHFKGDSLSPCSIWIDGEKVHEACGAIDFHSALRHGKHFIAVKSFHEEHQAWGFDLEASCGEVLCDFKLPLEVKGTDRKWLYMGVLKEAEDTIVRGLEAERVYPGADGLEYWRVDEPHMYVRAVLESSVFGKWSYPVGVVLYGILQTARQLKDHRMLAYANAHILICAKMYGYTLWDQHNFGFAPINHQMQNMDCLDNCGSFGSAMLESYQDNKDADVEAVAHVIGAYMADKQERREDGAFYRIAADTFCRNTLWADDLYMSVPFLCRYYRMTGDARYIDDAAKQFLLFRKYLYMPEENLMAHVYSFHYKKATNVPWGRGNGWVLFSLSELLEYLPEDHCDRGEIIHMFKQLCKGMASYQDTGGMWHQVINDPTTYEETSCTSMIIYALCRGMRKGWLDNTDYIENAERGWLALCMKSIDAKGNIYGVCVGSGYSFRSDYYKKELPWNINDTHGTGIVLLAGVEMVKLREWLEKGEAAQ